MAGFKKAKREQVWLKVLLSGSSGCGKSYSALRLAKGIASKCGSDIAYIGTEGSRDLYYANEFDLNIKGWLLNEPNYRLGLMAGYQESRYSFTARGGSYIYSSDKPGKLRAVSTYVSGLYTPSGTYMSPDISVSQGVLNVGVP